MSLSRHPWFHLTMGLLFAVALSSSAQEKKADNKNVDPSGTWRWTHDENGETVKNVLTINYDGKVVSGTYKGRSEKTIESAQIAGNKLSFKFDVDFQGQKIEVRFECAVKDDDLNGKVSMHAGGDVQEYPWTAKRTLETEDLVGTWAIKIVTGDGQTIEPELKLAKDGEKLKGTYRSIGLDREVEAQELKLADKQLTFTIQGENDGKKFKVKYAGQPRGDRMNGKIDYDLNGNTGTIDFAATRSKAKQ